MPIGFRDQLASRRAVCIMMGFESCVFFLRSGMAVFCSPMVLGTCLDVLLQYLDAFPILDTNQ